MPVMNGLETSAAIRKSESRTGGRIPIIAVTADAMECDRERCLAMGMDEYVSKPYTSAELFAAIDRVMRPGG